MPPRDFASCSPRPRVAGYIGIVEKKMETTIMGHIGILAYFGGYVGIMEKKMETTIMGLPIMGYIEILVYFWFM